MHRLGKKTSLTKSIKENLDAALTYFVNHRHMMDYATQIKKQLPIGSGVTEAACKTLVKQRFCGSGMRWKNKGTKVILSLRALVQSKGRWQQNFGGILNNMECRFVFEAHHFKSTPVFYALLYKN